jgi:hypothetical protein
MAGGWTLEGLPWDRFDPGRVDPDILRVVKAASMVESNGGDYATYLCNVFSDDTAFQAAARAWAQEEVQHGQALARWARLADPAFDYEAAFKRFTEGYSLPLDAEASVRGSRAGELVARCIVEVGTSSYYTALHDASAEPLLKEICKRIAADELRHYKLFYTHLKRYLESERIGRWRRLLVALGRITESEDDELAYAYYAANAGGEAYDRKRWSRAYLSRASGYYRVAHVQRAVAMTFKAAGLKPRGRLAKWAAWAAYRVLRARSRRPAAAGA